MKQTYKKITTAIVLSIFSFAFSFLLGAYAFSGVCIDKNYYTLSKIQENANSNSRFIQQFTTFDETFDDTKWDEYTKIFNDRYSIGNYATIFKVVQNNEIYINGAKSNCTFSDCVVYNDDYYNYNRITLIESYSPGFSDLKVNNSVYIPSSLAQKIKQDEGINTNGYSMLFGKKIVTSLFADELVIRGIYNENETIRPNCLNKLLYDTFNLNLIISRDRMNSIKSGLGCITFGNDLNKNLAIHDFLEGRFTADFRYFNNESNNLLLVNDIPLSSFYNNFGAYKIGLSPLIFAVLLIASTILFFCYFRFSSKFINMLDLEKIKSNKFPILACVSKCCIVLLFVFLFGRISMFNDLITYPLFKNLLSMWYSFGFVILSCVAFLLNRIQIYNIKQISNKYDLADSLLNNSIVENTFKASLVETNDDIQKTAVVFSRGIDDSTAGGQRTISDAICLSNLGYDVYLSGFINSKKSAPISGIKYRPWSSYRGKNIIKKFFWFGSSKHISDSVLEINKHIDVIVVYSVLSIAQIKFIIRYCKKYNIKLVFDVVEFQNFVQQTFRSFFTYYLPNMYINKIAIKKEHYVIAISEYLFDFFSKKGIRTIKLPFVNMAVTESTCKKINKLENIRIFLYAGSPGKKDNLFYMINAYSNLSSADLKKSRFVIAGPDSKLLYKIGITPALIEKCQGSLILINKLPFSELEKIYFLTDFSILYKNSHMRHAKADFPSKVSQCLSYGIPLVANMSSDLKYFLSNSYNSVICESKNIDEFTKTISRAINYNNDSISILKKNALKTAKECLSVNQGVAAFKELLEK